MFDTVQGLPVHALVLHFTVVLVPLMALVTVLVAFGRGRLRRVGAWPVVAANALLVGLVWVTQESGEALERRLGESAAIERHAEIADLMIWFALGLLVVSVLVALARSRRGPAPVVLGALTLVVAAAAVVWTVRTGHTGSEAVWQGIVDATNGR
ncbi:DUF2231 domain-containing protein [Angustibacter aerolatus]|nr:DUF2231 domain-containing protein [Angustibacter aerolatus]